jgi:hypothetical protein
MVRGLPCLKKKLESVTLHELVHQAPLQCLSSLAKKSLVTTDLHAMTCVFYLINEFNSRVNLKSLDSIAIVHFHIFTG